jgi:hypothetical protein
MSFLAPDNVAKVPVTWRGFEGVKVWLEEAVFGHRLWARQTPWLLFLEFLNVAEAHLREGKLFTPTEPDVASPHSLRYRMGLRNILFNNGELSHIAAQRFDDEALWNEWLSSMNGADAAPAEGFNYLRGRFQKFSDFADLVGLVRHTTLETSTNRRWSSRFVFPFGVDAIYSDAIIKNGQPSRDYNNFGRTGEILYLMLSRSTHTGALAERFEALFDADQPKNKLIGLLSAPSDARPVLNQRGDSFLPYRTHPAFDRLAEDWLAVLDLNLPGQDAYAHLAPLGMLHVMLYQLETASKMLGKPRPALVCEIIAPRRELVRQRSIANYNDNDALARQALSFLVESFLASPQWIAALDQELPDSERLEIALDILKSEFSYDAKDVRVTTPEELLAQFEQAVEDKHDDNCGLVHAAYGRNVGLVSRRGTNRYRYAPTDDLLKTLVVARVPKRAEFGKFLTDLYAQYGLVFGPDEAATALPAESYDNSTFVRNRERLEARLGSMGLLKRLSDGCAYVLNPLTRDGSL